MFQHKTREKELYHYIYNSFSFLILTLLFKNFIYYPVDSVNFDISVIEFEPFNEVVDLWNNNYLFKDKEEDNTIICYFCFAIHGNTEEEKEKNMKIYLLIKRISPVYI